jgi:hypothetical protein
VAKKSDKNLMTVGNLAVCFGPTLLRPEEETVASIIDIKFYNIVVELLIENCDRIIAGPPQDSLRATTAQSSTSQTTVTSSKSQCVKIEENPTSSGNGTAFLRYPPHTAVTTVVPTSSHAHVSLERLTLLYFWLFTLSIYTFIRIQLVTRAYYDGQPLSAINKLSIEERNNGDYEDLDNASHRIPSYLDGRGSGSRIKLTNANLMYHSAEKGLVIFIFHYFTASSQYLYIIFASWTRILLSLQFLVVAIRVVPANQSHQTLIRSRANYLWSRNAAPWCPCTMLQLIRNAATHRQYARKR